MNEESFLQKTQRPLSERKTLHVSHVHSTCLHHLAQKAQRSRKITSEPTRQNAKNHTTKPPPARTHPSDAALIERVDLDLDLDLDLALTNQRKKRSNLRKAASERTPQNAKPLTETPPPYAALIERVELDLGLEDAHPGGST